MFANYLFRLALAEADLFFLVLKKPFQRHAKIVITGGKSEHAGLILSRILLADGS